MGLARQPCGRMHYDTDACAECAKVKDALPLRTPEGAKLSRDHERLDNLPRVQKPQSARGDGSAEVETPVRLGRGSNDLDTMTPDELRAMLTTKREAKRVSQAKWRAKAK